jgi:hypothetical protein
MLLIKKPLDAWQLVTLLLLVCLMIIAHARAGGLPSPTAATPWALRWAPRPAAAATLSIRHGRVCVRPASPPAVGPAAGPAASLPSRPRGVVGEGLPRLKLPLLDGLAAEAVQHLSKQEVDKNEKASITSGPC